MIIKLLIMAITGVINLVINLLPSLTFTIPDGVLSGLTTIFANIVYFLPISGLMPILVIKVTIDNIGLIWSIVLRVKSFIPFLH